MRAGLRALYLCFFLASAGALAAGCRADGTPSPPGPAGKSQEASRAATRRGDACPVRVPGTTVTLVKTSSGAMLFFTTPAANVDAVRERVASLVQVARAAAANASPGADPGEPAPLRPVWDGRSQARLVPVQVDWSEEKDGARLTLTVEDPVHLKELHAYLERHVDRMRLGLCEPDFLAVAEPMNARGSAAANAGAS